MKSSIYITLFLFAGVTGVFSCRNPGHRAPGRSDRTDSSLNALPESHSDPVVASGDTLTICTFNIQFLGAFHKRDNEALADVVKDFNIVVVQEMVAPPVDGLFPDGTSYQADPESGKFTQAMKDRGFRFLLSQEDTGTGNNNHSNGTATEWFICFYDSTRVSFAPDLPYGFLADDRSNHPDFERVPYAFPFRSINNQGDFVLISIHLNPGSSETDAERRKHEISSIHRWIMEHSGTEKDFLILGDMNIEDSAELAGALPQGMVSLNDECRRTNTLINNTPPDFGAKPYDHIFYDIVNTSLEIDTEFDCQVIDLVTLLQAFWNGPGPYPGSPYVHNTFRQYYSDHHPLVFRYRVLHHDDD
ncbi:MAG TPA: hypothetical protein VI583_06580 [Cyclobacteriaceae bacterium]|nr:hypothetical protein [Cyclobacteriaceae bacterium]